MPVLRLVPPVLIALSLGVACRPLETSAPAPIDRDGDGYIDGYGADGGEGDIDCDDQLAYVNPSALELCNGIDDDCDGEVDEGQGEELAGEVPTWHGDKDHDGYGTDEDTVRACIAPIGYVENTWDCDDFNGDVAPGAAELCNGQDDDCDGATDEGDAIDRREWFLDQDADGYGEPGSPTLACDRPEGMVSNTRDCDDVRDDIHPGAVELCNGEDEDCDGQVDEGFANNGTEYWQDLDGDGFGDPTSMTRSCVEPFGFVADATDCDDANSGVNPAADELCNTVDDDCDGEIDEAGSVDGVPWFTDGDGDGFGDLSTQVTTCAQPAGLVGLAGDCDDNNALVNPDASEVCNDVDDDCNGSADDGLTELEWFGDVDQDAFGDPAVLVLGCNQPDGHVADDSDCDDLSAAVSPAEAEVCNGIDDNCDGEVDESGALGERESYSDFDGDGYGAVVGTTVVGCDVPDGFADNTDDCDDTEPLSYPDADELCDGLDNDCDFVVDDTPVDAPVWYPDVDGDGSGDILTATIACVGPAGWVNVPGDCDDTVATTFPGALEFCNFTDDDCDGLTDEDPIDGLQWFEDQDGDGYGSSASAVAACTQPTGLTGSAGDCDDGDATMHPAPDPFADIPGDGVDLDCDALDFCTDLNCDTEPDLMALVSGAGVHALRIYHGQRVGARFSDSHMTELVISGAPSLSRGGVGDFSGDGRMDVVTTYGGGLRSFYLGTDEGSGLQDTTPESGLSGAIGSVITSDLDRDGYDDLVILGDPTEILYGPFDGASWSAEGTLSTGPVGNGSIADVDADGLDDLVVNNPSGVTVYYGSFSGFSGGNAVTLPTSSAWGGQTYNHATGDLDDDGFVDVAVGCRTPGGYCEARIFWGSDTGPASVDYTPMSAPQGPFYIRDLDSDGHTDFITGADTGCCGSVTEIRTWWGPFDAGTSDLFLPGMSSNHTVLVADFDLDGYDDLVLNGPSSGQSGKYVRGGAAGWTVDPAFALPRYGIVSHIADLNRDGYPDLVNNHQIYYGGPGGLALGDTVDLYPAAGGATPSAIFSSESIAR